MGEVGFVGVAVDGEEVGFFVSCFDEDANEVKDQDGEREDRGEEEESADEHNDLEAVDRMAD